MFFPPLFYGFHLVQEVLWFALLLIVVVTVTRVRAEPDPGGHRLTACFLAVVMGVSLIGAVLASTVAVGEAASLLRDDVGYGGELESEPELGFEEGDSVFFEEDEPGREDEYAGMLQAALVAAAAFAVFVYHRRKLDDLLADAEVREGAAGDIAEGYRHVVSFLALAALVGGAATAAFGVVKLAAPGAFSTEEADFARQVAGGTVFVGGWLAAVAVSILSWGAEGGDEEDGDEEDDEGPLVEPPVEPPTEEAPIP